MKNLLLIFLVIASCGSKDKDMSKKNEVFLQIDFQSLFDKDVATLLVNDCIIFENTILESDKIDGVTNISLELQKDDDNFLTVEKYNEIDCQFNNDDLVLKVLLNKVVSIFTIDLSQGKYIGFDKGVNNKIELNQSVEPFEYD